MGKLWGGRFRKKTDPIVEMFTKSIHYDHKLAQYDVLGSIAHAKMLGKCNIITKHEASALVKGLEGILKDIEAGRFEFDWDCEDIHTNIQNELQMRIGKIAKKLHTARSRNDQVSLDLRMYCRDSIITLVHEITDLQKSLLKFSKQNREIIIPGYTHLQRAQPVLLAHHILAYMEMFQRDRQRIYSTHTGVWHNFPLGSCALAGTSLPIDREYTARLLNFTGVSRNSIDSVSDRDFAIEFLSGMAILAMHLSRLSEDLILWSTSEFAFIDIDESFCTGSSIMPHKKNPDVLELIRGNTGRIYGNLISVLVMMKGLPLSYNRDMQHDKEPLFDSVERVKGSLGVMIRLIQGNIKVNKERLKGLFDDESLFATDMAEYLVNKGMAFQEAHETVGKLIAYCIRGNKKVSDLSLTQLKTFSKKFDKDIYKLLNPDQSVRSKTSYGGTSPVNVRKVIDAWEKEFEREKKLQ